MIIPTIHLNGTSKEQLTGALSAAYDGLNAAYDLLKQTAPNGRDYYPQGGDAMEMAVDEHMSRLRRIDNVMCEIEQILANIEATVSS